MATQVEASTIKAGQLFATAEFQIPDFQRDYSWTANEEVTDFWNDLSKGIDSPPYFLGLLIITEEHQNKTVVDGQQRLVTLSLLANSIRKAAHGTKKTLVADSMRDIFLYSVNYATDTRSPRIRFASDRDRRTYQSMLDGTPLDASPSGMNLEMISAQRLLDSKLQEELRGQDSSARLAKWAHFLTNGITFALFEHPDRNAAFKVFEIVNTRGKDLTPAQLIKSFVIGSSPAKREEVSERWTELENPFLGLGAEAQFTQFIRSVVTLHRGYVEARNLYQEISQSFEGEWGTAKLLTELEQNIDFYLQMVSPPLDSEHIPAKTFVILDALGLRTIRSIFLATSYAETPDEGYQELLRIIVPRIVAGNFGTGNIERRFSEAARDIYGSRRWENAVGGLQDLAPSRDDFRESVKTRSLNKGTHAVLRASGLQQTIVPELSGYLYQVRPRKVDYWPDFSDEDFRVVGSTVGNFLTSSLERRPRGTNNLQDVLSRLLPSAIPNELAEVKGTDSWSANDVRAFSERFSEIAAEVWYD